MCRTLDLRVLVCIVGLIVLPAPAVQAQVVIANWRFEPGAFLSDSSGNNHTLMPVIAGGTHDPTSDAGDVIGQRGGGGSALFDGQGGLRTVTPLDLRGLDHLRIRWDMKRPIPGPNVPNSSPKVIFEHSPQFDLVGNRGAFLGAVNTNNLDLLPGNADSATRGFLSLATTTATGAVGRISDLYPHLAATDPGVWESFSIEINLASPTQGCVVRVFDSQGIEIGTNLDIAPLPATFVNDTFFIGARGLLSTLGFVGNIDELVIDVPTTATACSNNPPTPPPEPPTPPNPPTPPVPPIPPFPPIGTSGADGVIVDAEGVLRLRQFRTPNAALAKKRLAEARARLNPQVAMPSKLRKVSLNRLEAAVRAQLDKGRPPTDEMQYLAGLTRVRYVFYYPDTKDIVLAGPAGGWGPDPTNRICSIDSGRPVLQLQDLVVALRAFPEGKRPVPVILCSIDPTSEGLVRMQEFLRSIGSHATPDDTDVIVNGLRNSLGMQNIRIAGVAPNTHFAQVLLECDYRMKLIGIGVEKPPVKIATYVDRATPSSNRSALQRWFFIPDYNCARVATDDLGLELVGDVVKLVSENQVVNEDGSRVVAAKGNKASDLFARTFTLKYAEIAARVPVFAEMRNVIDLSVAAAFIHQQDFYAQAGWRATTFNDEEALRVEIYRTPLQVETVCVGVWKGNHLMTPVGGGVTIHADAALRVSNLLKDEDGKISEIRESVELKDLPPGQWWWD